MLSYQIHILDIEINSNMLGSLNTPRLAHSSGMYIQLHRNDFLIHLCSASWLSFCSAKDYSQSSTSIFALSLIIGLAYSIYP